MRIGIDARFYGLIGKGIGRYLEQLIKHLEKIDFENEYYVFLRRANFDDYQPTNPRWHKVLADYPWYSWQEQIYLPFKLRKYKLDFVHFPHFNVPLFYFGKFVVTIHDLILLKFNRQASTHWPIFYALKYLFFRLIISSAIKKATKILTVSKFVKNQIIHYYKIDPNKIVVTYESANMTKKTLSMNIQYPYLLYVGNAYPHKNLERLLFAFAKVTADKQANIKLVLVGKIDYFYQRLQKLVKELNLSDKVIFTGAVSDEKLANLYQNALAYVFPSLMEGFGLPGLEAMAHNCPVISSNAGSLPEIYGQAALYFDPKDIKDMAEKIRKIISDQELREKLKKLGREQIKKYSWDTCAKQTLEVYKSISKNINH